jgi:diaminohydroxyphosphoribosylaminopyrimidine deaminase/5-amino-6-(5-phosphoribosylamino)uracil reductase
MAQALTLAERGRGSTRPNPMVGAVVIADGELVGEGFHERAGEPHAEVHALRAAGVAAQGATVYVTLEPCCFRGRTGPCTEALIEAGVARVVVGSQDPNPRVAGDGITRLREAGIDVTSGVLEDACWELNVVFNHWVTTNRPLVVLKLATTLDGRIAAASGESQWITGALARAEVHAMRAHLDAVMVGSGTALADDPRLTARGVELPGGQPTRILVDGRLRVPPSAKLFTSEGSVIVATTQNSGAELGALQDSGADVLTLPADGAHVDLGALLDALGAREPDPITGLLVEGGGGLSTALIEADLVDRLHLFVAPTFMGGDGLAAVGSLGVTHPDEAPRFDVVQLNTLGDDLEIVLTRRR